MMTVAEVLPPACIMDLDGTLVDSLADIAEALNECLDLLGLPTRPINAYRYMVGEGIPALCRRVLGESHSVYVERLTELARARYRVRPLRHTRPYPGIPEMVSRLKVAGVRLAILSNKPHELTLRVAQAFWPDGVFEYVQGYVEEELRKPDPHYVLQICEHLRVSPARTWVVGDTPTDVETARRAGAVPVGVAWGFRTRSELETAGARFVFDRPEQIAAGVARLPSSPDSW